MYGVEKKENAADISRFGVWKKKTNQIKWRGPLAKAVGRLILTRL